MADLDDSLYSTCFGANTSFRVSLLNISAPLTTTITTITTIADMPDNIYRMIFSNLKLQKLLSIRRVCKKWQKLINAKLAEQETLKIFRDYRSMEHYCYQLINNGMQNDVSFLPNNDYIIVKDHRKIHDDYMVILSKLFPSVRHLVVYNFELFPQFNVASLLMAFRQIDTFVMFHLPIAKHWPYIWKHLNRMKRLKQLYIFGIVEIRQIEIEMPVFSELTHFTLTGPYFKFRNPLFNRKGIIQFLDKLSPSVTHLNLMAAELKHFPSSFKKVANNVIHLTIDEPNIKISCLGEMYRETVISRICKNFTQLTFLNITIGTKLDFFHLLKELVKLTKLRELKLPIDIRHQKVAKDHPKLQLIERLCLHIYIPIGKEKDPRNRKFLLSMAKCVPNLQQLDIICSQCEVFKPLSHELHLKLPLLTKFEVNSISMRVSSLLNP